MTPTPQDPGSELLPINVIRTETVLSRFPIHNLSKSRRIDITIKQHNISGELDIQWEVSYSDRYGQARLLAYKLDTLIVNRYIEEAGRPLPKRIRLGTLHEIALELGLGGDTNLVKKAFRQNASTFITAKITYKGTDGKERNLEAAFHRYSIVFTGETLPDGKKADAVYLVLNDIYREVLDTATFRPLDYDYLKSLSPTAQRWYEVVSYAMFAANKHKLPTADIAYSEYCTYSGQERYYTWDKVKKQMYKLHQPHLKSNFITGFTHTLITDQNDNPDWILKYTPGAKAKAEYRAFQRTKRERIIDMNAQISTSAASLTKPAAEPSTPQKLTPQPEPAPEPQTPSLTAEQQNYVNELVSRFSIHEDTALELVTTKLDNVKLQLEVYHYRQKGRIKDPAAYLIRAIQQNYAPPSNYADAKAKMEREELAVRVKALEEAKKTHEEKYRAQYLEYLRQKEQALKTNHPDEYLAFEEHNATSVARSMRVVKNPSGVAGRTILSEEARLIRLRDFFLPRKLIADFWSWDRSHNPAAFTAPVS